MKFFLILLSLSSSLFSPDQGQLARTGDKYYQQSQQKSRFRSRLEHKVASSISSYDPFAGVTLGETEIDSGFARRPRHIANQEAKLRRAQEIDQQIAQNRAKRNQIINEFNESQRQAVERVRQLKNEIDALVAPSKDKINYFKNKYQEASDRYESLSREQKALVAKVKELDEALEKNREAQSEIVFNPYFDLDLYPIEIPEKTFEEVEVPQEIQISPSEEIILEPFEGTTPPAIDPGPEPEKPKLDDKFSLPPIPQLPPYNAPKPPTLNFDGIIFPEMAVDAKDGWDGKPTKKSLGLKDGSVISIPITALLTGIKNKIKKDNVFNLTESDRSSPTYRAQNKYLGLYFDEASKIFTDQYFDQETKKTGFFKWDRFNNNKKEIIIAFLCFARPNKEFSSLLPTFFQITEDAQKNAFEKMNKAYEETDRNIEKTKENIKNFAKKITEDLNKILKKDGKNFLHGINTSEVEKKPVFFEEIYKNIINKIEKNKDFNTDDKKKMLLQLKNSATPMLKIFFKQIVEKIDASTKIDSKVTTLIFEIDKYIDEIMKEKLIIIPVSEKEVSENRKHFDDSKTLIATTKLELSQKFGEIIQNQELLEKLGKDAFAAEWDQSQMFKLGQIHDYYMAKLDELEQKIFFTSKPETLQDGQEKISYLAKFLSETDKKSLEQIVTKIKNIIIKISNLIQKYEKAFEDHEEDLAKYKENYNDLMTKLAKKYKLETEQEFNNLQKKKDDYFNNASEQVKAHQEWQQKRNAKKDATEFSKLDTEINEKRDRTAIEENEERQSLELQLQEGLSRNRTQQLEKANQIQQEKDAYNKELDAADEADQISIELLEFAVKIEAELETLSPEMPIDELSNISKEKFAQFYAKLEEIRGKARSLVFKEKVFNDIKLATKNIEKKERDFEEKIGRLKPLKDEEASSMTAKNNLVKQVKNLQIEKRKAAEDENNFKRLQNNEVNIYNDTLGVYNEKVKAGADEINKILNQNSNNSEQADLEIDKLDKLYNKLRQQKSDMG